MSQSNNIKITVLKDVELGTWQGMGGALTEATAYNFAKLSPEKQRRFLDAYYSKDGLDYRWARISIGSNDFCLKSYEYTKKADLSDFSIEHDQKWLLPLLKRVLKRKRLKIVAAPWSPPKCLKWPPMQRHGGFLKPWRYGRYADYLCKWRDAYAAEGVRIDYLSPQNEPRAAQIWESCRYSYRAQRKLARTLSRLNIPLLLWDHNKRRLAKVADKLLPGTPAAGLCFHWYNGTHPDQMWQVRQKYPDKLLVSSEMCCGFSPYGPGWSRDARLYLGELLNDINCGTSAWIDWNMLLDYRGGPSYCRNYVKSPIILNETENDFILTPIYHALKHFAKLCPAGSKIIRCDYDSTSVAATARKIAKGYEVILANLTDEAQKITLQLGEQEKTLTLSEGALKSMSLIDK
ncbi:hypothetical protein IKG50_01455 [Candidatus Saccharibacteria bacterium]|nr:hypothetical protein [Candidatus Saccharibacteria bacterium]